MINKIKITKLISYIIITVILTVCAYPQVVIKDTVVIIPKHNFQKTTLEANVALEHPTITYTLTFQNAAAYLVRVIHYNKITSSYDLDVLVSGNGTYVYTFPVTPPTEGIEFYYYAWGGTGVPNLNYIIDAELSANGEKFHKEGVVAPRFNQGDFNSGGISVTIPYYTGLIFVLWNEVWYKGFFVFSNTYDGRLYAYNNPAHSTFWYPATDSLTLSITSGEEYASFYSYPAGVKLGRSVTTLVNQINRIRLVIEQPPYERTELAITATVRSISETRTTYIQGYPIAGYNVYTKPDVIHPGEETQLWIDMLDKDDEVIAPGAFPFGVTITSSDSDEKGRYELRYPESWPYDPVITPANVPYTEYSTRGNNVGEKINTFQGYVYYVADTSALSEDKEITFSVKDTYVPSRTGAGSLVIKGEDESLCPVVSIVPATIKAGETADIIVKGMKQDGTTVDYPEGTQFTFTITSGSECGTVIGNTSPSQFKANEDINFPEGTGEVNVTMQVKVGNGISALIKNTNNAATMSLPSCPEPEGNLLVQDKCIQPESVPRCSGTTIQTPNVVTKINTNGFAGENVNECQIHPNEFAFFTYSSNQFVEPYITEICYDESNKSWKFNLPEIKVNTIIGECTDKLKQYQLVKSLKEVNSINSKCCAMKDFKGLLDNYPIVTRQSGFVIYEAIMEHENVHKRDFEADLAIAKKSTIDLVLSSFKPTCSSYPTMENAREEIEKTVKNTLQYFMEIATELWKSRTQTDQVEDDKKRNQYETQTQRNSAVHDLIKNYIRTLGYISEDCVCY